MPLLLVCLSLPHEGVTPDDDVIQLGALGVVDEFAASGTRTGRYRPDSDRVPAAFSRLRPRLLVAVVLPFVAGLGRSRSWPVQTLARVACAAGYALPSRDDSLALTPIV